MNTNPPKTYFTLFMNNFTFEEVSELRLSDCQGINIQIKFIIQMGILTFGEYDKPMIIFML